MFKRIWGRLTASKEQNFVKRVEDDLSYYVNERMKLLHQKALIDSAIAANESKQHHMQQCLLELRKTLEEGEAKEAAERAVKVAVTGNGN